MGAGDLTANEAKNYQPQSRSSASQHGFTRMGWGLQSSMGKIGGEASRGNFNAEAQRSRGAEGEPLISANLEPHIRCTKLG
jgi:hypothetical protein